MDTRAATPLSGPQELIAHFPLPGVILRKDGSIMFENARGEVAIARSWLAEQGPALKALAGGEQVRVMNVTAGDGAVQPAVVYAAPLGEHTVVVVDQRGSAATETARLQARIAELEQLSATDRLTGLWNRRHFDAMVARELAFSDRERTPLTLLLFDIDHFKRVNDDHGHATGDLVLRTLAARLREGARPTDLLFRWGGEEFALLAPATSIAGGTALAERLRIAVSAQPFPGAGPLTISAGVAEHVADEAPEAWFKRLDAALYRAKEGGRNRVVAAPDGASTSWAAQSQTSALQLVWSDRYASGHGLVDDEHRALFAATNRLVELITTAGLDAPAVRVQVDALLEAVACHFSDEEAVLEKVAYPRLADHRALHAKLLAAAARLRDAVHEGRNSPAEVVEFIAYEIVNRHILTADRQFFPFLAPLRRV